MTYFSSTISIGLLLPSILAFAKLGPSHLMAAVGNSYFADGESVRYMETWLFGSYMSATTPGRCTVHKGKLSVSFVMAEEEKQ